MIGNVSTEESRKEIRKSPGAPSPPANVTIFCFHPFNLVAKRNSSHSSAATCLCGALDLGADGRCQRAAIVQKLRDRKDSCRPSCARYGVDWAGWEFLRCAGCGPT